MPSPFSKTQYDFYNNAELLRYVCLTRYTALIYGVITHFIDFEESVSKLGNLIKYY